MLQKKTIFERCFHAVLFEFIALLICVPLMTLVLNVSVTHAGALTLMISLVAMSWNVIFNTLFERMERHYGWTRTFAVRSMHAIVFEIGLILAVVPLAAWWLDISLVRAFVLDIALVLFFLPYTMVYNWVYDVVRANIMRKRLDA